MCINKFTDSLKIIEQNRFLMVGVADLLLSMQEVSIVHSTTFTRQLQQIDELNWILALILRLSLIGTQWKSSHTPSLVLNTLWLGYFLTKGVLLQSKLDDASLILKIFNQILLCLDVWSARNIQQGFHLILYALGYFVFVDFFNWFPQSMLTGAFLCHLMMHCEKIDNDSQWLHLIYQLSSLVCLPVLTIFVFEYGRGWALNAYWLSIMMLISFMDYMLKKSPQEVQIACEFQLSPV